jgi:hypothetical protein
MTVSYTPVGRDVSRFQQLTLPTDTSLTGFDIIFSNTTITVLDQTSYTWSSPLPCVHRPPQYNIRIELASCCCTFPHIHFSSHQDTCYSKTHGLPRREMRTVGNVCLRDDFEDLSTVKAYFKMLLREVGTAARGLFIWLKSITSARLL